jgi:hypothetical protein
LQFDRELRGFAHGRSMKGADSDVTGRDYKTFGRFECRC